MSKAEKQAEKVDRKPKDPADRTRQVQEVIALIEGGASENAACEKVGINRATFRAAALREGAGDAYARALESLAQDQIEKLEVTIQDMREKTITPEMARVEIDARKWFAAKFLPKRYGDKVQLADAEGNKLPPAPQFIVQPVMPAPPKADDPE